MVGVHPLSMDTQAFWKLVAALLKQPELEMYSREGRWEKTELTIEAKSVL
jgi:hypothetical protein